jgi:hypothetical protein
MDPLVMGAIIAGIVLLGIATYAIANRQRRILLHARYGREYDRTVARLGHRRAITELQSRKERVETLDIHPLTSQQRSRYANRWHTVQSLFVDDPQGAVAQGDQLVDEVMRARGYPVVDFDQRVADLSVNHARVVQNYRAARVIAHRHRRGEGTTEDLRQAMIYYRALFEDLLEDRDRPSVRTAEREVDRRVEREVGAEPQRVRPPARSFDDEMRS